MLRILLITLTLMLVGCVSLDPAYHRPDSNLILSTNGKISANNKLSLGYPDIPWNSYIVEPKLRKVVEMGLTSSRDLHEAISNIKSAQALSEQQRSNLFPSVSAGLDGSRSRALTGEGNSTAVTDSFKGTAATSSFELDLFGKNQSLSRKQYETYLGTIEAAKSTRLSVINSIVTYWVTLAADHSNLSAAQQTMDSALQSLNVTRMNQKNGVASMVDVSSAEGTYQSARADVANYTTVAEQTRNALDLVTGKHVPENLLPENIEGLGTIMKDVPAGISSAVLYSRPDVVKAEHDLKAANASIGAARANFFPSITLTASGGVGSSDLSTLFNNGAGIWSFSPSINLPIFKGGYNMATLKYSEAQKEFYVATYEKTVQTAFKEVLDALVRKSTIDEQLNAQRENVAYSQQYYHLADLRYRTGVATFLNAMIAQRTFYTAKKSLIVAQKSYYLNLISIYKVMGGGEGGRNN